MVLDLFLVLFIGGLMLMGLRSGLIHESITLIGLLVGLLVAGRYYPYVGPIFMPWLKTTTVSSLAAFLALLFGAWALMLILGALLREMLEGLHLGWIDNIGGALLGVVKGLFLAEIIVLIVMAVPAKGMRDMVAQSYIGNQLAQLAPKMLDLVPPLLRYWKPI